MRMSGRISEPVCADEASHGETEETRFRSPANLDVSYMYEICACAYGYMCVVNMCALRNMCSHTRFRFRSPANLYVSYIYMYALSLALSQYARACRPILLSLARSLKRRAGQSYSAHTLLARGVFTLSERACKYADEACQAGLISILAYASSL